MHRRWAVQTWTKPWSPGSLACRPAIALDLPRCNGKCAGQHSTATCPSATVVWDVDRRPLAAWQLDHYFVQ